MSKYCTTVNSKAFLAYRATKVLNWSSVNCSSGLLINLYSSSTAWNAFPANSDCKIIIVAIINMMRYKILYLTNSGHIHDIEMVVRKPIFEICDQIGHRTACSATDTSWNVKIICVVGLDIILCRTPKTKVLIRLCRCAVWSAPLLIANHRRQVFLQGGPYRPG